MSDVPPAARRRIPRYLLHGVLVLLAVAMFLPIYWLVVTSVSSADQAFSVPPTWFPSTLTGANYARTFEVIPFGVQIVNSLLVTVAVVLGQLLTSSLAAFAFARLRFRGNRALFLTFLVALMVPLQVTVIPIFILMRTLGLLDNLAALILPGLLSVFGIFFLRQHFLSLPAELEDAALVDGAGYWRVLFQIYLPLSGPILAALSIFSALATWNDFFWPNIMITSPERMTIPVGLVYLQAGLAGAPAELVFAAIATITVPLLVLYLVAQDHITRGVALTGVSR